MNATDLTTVDPSTHFIAIAIIVLIAFFLAVIFAGMALFEHIADGIEESEPGEVDITYSIEDEDNVIFRS